MATSEKLVTTTIIPGSRAERPESQEFTWPTEHSVTEVGDLAQARVLALASDDRSREKFEVHITVSDLVNGEQYELKWSLRSLQEPLGLYCVIKTLRPPLDGHLSEGESGWFEVAEGCAL